MIRTHRGPFQSTPGYSVAISIQKGKVHIYVPSVAEYKNHQTSPPPPPNSPTLSKSHLQQGCTLVSLKEVVCIGLKGKFWELGTGAWTQGLTLTKQVFYHLSHSTNPTSHFKKANFWSFVFFYTFTKGGGWVRNPGSSLVTQFNFITGCPSNAQSTRKTMRIAIFTLMKRFTCL
jgi:hypothetical protein